MVLWFWFRNRFICFGGECQGWGGDQSSMGGYGMHSRVGGGDLQIIIGIGYRCMSHSNGYNVFVCNWDIVVLLIILSPIEELNSYYALILGLSYNLLISKKDLNEKV